MIHFQKTNRLATFYNSFKEGKKEVVSQASVKLGKRKGGST